MAIYLRNEVMKALEEDNEDAKTALKICVSCNNKKALVAEYLKTKGIINLIDIN